MIPETFTTDYTGEPGARAFFLQGRGDEGSVTFMIEKQQVAVLAEKLRELLILIDEDDTVGSTVAGRDPALGLDAPFDTDTRVGAIGLAYDEGSDRMIVYVQAMDADRDLVAGEEDEGEDVQFELRRDQARAFVLHAIAVVNEGRPTCQLCGLPIDPAGHQCPASNGHRLTG
jgi:uncharacterized repeat protein (TIGR03847 family)